MDILQGEIFWIDISTEETKGSEQYGRRPFVVMSRDAVNRKLRTVVVVPLTTHNGQVQEVLQRLTEQPPFRIIIPPAEITRDMSGSSEILLCVAKTDQARVVDKTRLLQKMGRLSTTATIAVGAGLAFLFDLR